MLKVLVFFAGLVAATFALGQGVLENPAPDSYQSGIGVISGWHCTASRIEIQIDDHPRLLAGSHTQRNDTTSVCGHANTGFSLLFAWNILPTDCFGCFYHRIVAFADGVEFARTTFRMANFPVEYLHRPHAGSFELPNFPTLGWSTSLTWDAERQAFAIAGVGAQRVSPARRYWGGLRPGPTSPSCLPGLGDRRAAVVNGTFDVSIAGGSMSFKAELADGTSCQLGSTPLDEAPAGGFYSARLAPSDACPMFPGGVKVKADGLRVMARGLDNCAIGELFGASDVTFGTFDP